MEEELKNEKMINEELFSLEDLINNSEALTGYKKEVVVGALFNCNKREMSKKEFIGRIKSFLGKKVE